MFRKGTILHILLLTKKKLLQKDFLYIIWTRYCA